MVNGCKMKYKFQARFEVFKEGWLGRNVIAAYQTFLESQKNLGWDWRPSGPTFC